jgi:hypothetical protein
MRSGIEGRPTAEPSTLNLLLRGSVAEYQVQIVGAELFCTSMDNFKLSITALPSVAALNLPPD